MKTRTPTRHERSAPLFTLALALAGCFEAPRGRGASRDGGSPEDTHVARDQGAVDDVPPASDDRIGAQDLGVAPGPAPEPQDAGGVGARCTAFGDLALTDARSVVVRSNGGIINYFRVVFDASGAPPQSVLTAYNGRVATVPLNATLRFEDDPQNATWEGCIDCLLVTADCDAQYRNCRSYYVSRSGFARFSALARSPGERFDGTYAAVALHEARLTSDGSLREVAGGRCIAIERLSFATQAVDYCASAQSCGACVPAEGCGWCASADRCMQGDAACATFAACSGSTWVFGSQACPAPMTPRDAGADTGAADAGGLGSSGAMLTEGSCSQEGSVDYRSCQSDGGCASTTPECVLTSYPGRFCAIGCSQSAECPSSGVCIAFGAAGRCMRSCVASCPSGMRCVSYRSTAGASQRVCAPEGWTA